MKRVSHPNMKPGQRKHRALSDSEQWLSDRLLLARAKAVLQDTPSDHPQYDTLTTRVKQLETELEATS